MQICKLHLSILATFYFLVPVYRIFYCSCRRANREERLFLQENMRVPGAEKEKREELLSNGYKASISDN